MEIRYRRVMVPDFFLTRPQVQGELLKSKENTLVETYLIV